MLGLEDRGREPSFAPHEKIIFTIFIKYSCILECFYHEIEIYENYFFSGKIIYQNIYLIVI